MLICCLAEFETKPIRWSTSVAASCTDTLVMHVSSFAQDVGWQDWSVAVRMSAARENVMHR